MYKLHEVVQAKNGKWNIKTEHGMIPYAKYMIQAIYGEYGHDKCIMYLDGDHSNVSLANLRLVRAGVPQVVGNLFGGVSGANKETLLKIQQAELLLAYGDKVQAINEQAGNKGRHLYEYRNNYYQTLSREKKKQYSNATNEKKKKRMQEDPEYRAKMEILLKARHERYYRAQRERMQEDPEYAERIRAKQRKSYAKYMAKKKGEME